MGNTQASKMNFKLAMVVLSLVLLELGVSESHLPDTFGVSHLFQPLPDMSVGAHCKWEVRYSTVYNRIPKTLTEIACIDQNESCGGHSSFVCREIRAKMVVAYYTDQNALEDNRYRLGPSLYKRNITVGIGCSCVLQHSHGSEGFIQTHFNKRGGIH